MTARKPRPHTARTRPLALAYVRVSTDRQADEGVSLDAQTAALQAEAAHRGWDIEVIPEAGQSGKSLDKRPLLRDALDRLDAGHADALLAVRIDRLSRSVHDFTGLVKRAKDNGWDVVMLDPAIDMSTPSGRLIANVLISIGEFERELISQRTREGLSYLKAEGVVLGTPQTLRPDVRARVKRMRLSGMSLAAIAEQLNTEGVKSARGGRWWPSTVRSAIALSDQVCSCAWDTDHIVRTPAPRCPRHAVSDRNPRVRARAAAKAARALTAA